jgi:hypothetical protein
MDVGHSKAGGSIPVLHHNLSDLGIGKQRQKLGTLIIDATTTLFDDFGNSPPLGIAPTDQPLGLPLQVALVLATRYTGVHSHCSYKPRAQFWRIDE